MKDLSEQNFIELYKELDDGTIDDIAGEGYWHIEKLQKGIFALTISDEDNNEFINLKLITSNGDIKLILPTHNEHNK